MTNYLLGAASVNQTPMAWDENTARLRTVLAEARSLGVSILCLPESAVTGYGCEDMFFSTEVQQTALDQLKELLPETAGLFTTLGVPLAFDGSLYNAVGVAFDGQLLGFVCKQFLADDGIHYEPRWFSPWTNGRVEEVEFDGKKVPVGDLVFDCDGVRIGIEICRDAWVENRPGQQLVSRGAQVLLNPSASHFAFSKQRVREQLLTDAVEKWNVSVAYSNLLGNESGRSVYDGGTLLGTAGKFARSGPRFSFQDHVLTTLPIEIDKGAGTTRVIRGIRVPFNVTDWPLATGSAFGGWAEEWGVVQSNTPLSTLTVSDVGHDTPLSQDVTAPPSVRHESWECGPNDKEEEFARAVSLALFDYLRKSHTQGFVISLSGGADSACVATMVHLMVQLAIENLGEQGFQKKLAHVRGLDDCKNVTAKLLTCVYQATRNSSDVTFNAAKQLAKAIGSGFLDWNIDQLVDGYIETVSNALGTTLNWQSHDTSLQNIQARARGPGVWLVANLQQKLLLTTSNRSEAAVGYATMDGDTCGGLAPIAGIDKAYLRKWLTWMETTAPEGFEPLAALAAINNQQPTAELRPKESHQTDEDDLMPYEVLDAIERAAIRDKLLPVAAWQAVQPQFTDHSSKQLGQWVIRFFELWCRNQWKRERYAPSFHLDDENLDPKTWCRFPILNSGFERELERLRCMLQK